MSQPELIIRSVSDGQQRDAVLKAITQAARVRYGCDPPPALPQLLFAAYEGDTIMGSTSLDFSVDDQPLLLENSWQFNPGETPFPFVRSELVQYGRWWASLAGGQEHVVGTLAPALLYVATVFARSYGKKTCLCEIKPAAVRLLEKFGVEPKEVPGAVFHLERIPPAGRAYYQEKGRPSQLHMIDLVQMEQATQKHVKAIQRIKLTLLMPQLPQ